MNKSLILREKIEKAGIVAEDPVMVDLYRKALYLAQNKASVLLRGPSGAGKDCMAKFIHQSGPRADRPFIHINCSAIPNELFESELFGYDPGTFTGSGYAGKKGILESAQGGTVFLDEIGETSLANQVAFLQFLQTREIRRLGSKHTTKLDVRIISATNRDLKKMIDEGTFRHDLYYRLRVVELLIPPLRDRPQDLLALLDLFGSRLAEQFGEKKEFSKDAYDYLLAQPWSGNVRELQNFIERLYVLEEDTHIERQTLDHYRFDVIKTVIPTADEYKQYVSLKDAVATFERNYIEKAISEAPTLAEAARRLNISLVTLNRKKQQYGLYKKEVLRKNPSF